MKTKYFLVSTTADAGRKYYYPDANVKGIGASGWRLAEGESLFDSLGTQIEANWIAENEKDYPNLELPSFIGNPFRYFPVLRDVAEIITSTSNSNIEVLPIKVHDHHSNLLSSDYVILNPLGVIDCINVELSKFTRARSGKILSIPHLVLSLAKLNGKPHFFRMLEDPSTYTLSEVLVNKIVESRATNFYVKEIIVSE